MAIPEQKSRSIAFIKRVLRDETWGKVESKIIEGQKRLAVIAIGGIHIFGLVMQVLFLNKTNEQRLQRGICTQILFASLFLSKTAFAYPEFRGAVAFPRLIGSPRSTVTVIYNDGTISKPKFKMAYPAIVPVNGDGKILWFEDESWRAAPFHIGDRVVIEKDMLGSDVQGSYHFNGCAPLEGEKLSTPQGIAWLVSCPPDITNKINSTSLRVVYDPHNAEISSRFYTYKFKKDNHMLFETVTLKGDREHVVSRDSHLYIRSDVKNFFTLDFSSDDIESKLKKKRVEPLAAFASLGFYLKVLFFKITLDLSTDVGFFESSANIPMVMTLPVNAFDRLHRKSGVLYNFRLGDGIDPKAIKVVMPRLEANAFSGDFERMGLAYCYEMCVYELEVPNPVKPLKMKISIARQLVERGMFPWFVDDVAKYREAMRWDLKNGKDRLGLYFEVSKLPKGSHPWDFWLTF